MPLLGNARIERVANTRKEHILDVEDLERIFDLLDVNGDGEDLERIFDLLDVNGDGEVITA
ncbi:hypothetical protein T484DRAFT_1833094 [Baffinella frigidus]|nr:hypothetical protein T484DRAFT_1833094 [Cryptophyta sp. CCMP2293]